jgi:hypothetical protein
VNTECSSNVGRYAGRTFSIDWGDGTYPQQNGRNTPCGVHTYTVAGAYTARGKVYDFSDVNEFNGSFTRDVWTGTASVSTSGSGSSNQLSVRSGSDALTVVSNFTSGRACAEAYQLSWGDGTALVTQVYAPAGGCAMDLRSNEYSHTYAAAGTYVVVLRQGINLERTYSTTVTVTTSTAGASISVSESPSSVAKGQNVSISWSSQNAPTASVVLLRLVNASTGAGEGIIARAQSTSGSYTWTIPTASGVSCPDCGGIQTVKIGLYKISAEIYTPSNAYLGDTYPPLNPPLPSYHASAMSSAFSITQ